MKREAAISLSIAFASLALLVPQFAHAAPIAGMPAAKSSVNAPAGLREASMMVPAQADLVRALDSRKLQPGNQFQARLSNTVHLKNGLELPRGTMLVGTVVTDHMQVKGASRLALRFTQAKLKGGKVIPIKATIMGVTPPGYAYYSAQTPAGWDGKTLQMDQVGVLAGTDLHSAIARRNSGVFVSTKRDDVKLSSGSRIVLAIAPRQGNHQS